MARKKVEVRVEERPEETLTRVSEEDRALKLCEEIAKILKLIQTDVSELKKRFV